MCSLHEVVGNMTVPDTYILSREASCHTYTRLPPRLASHVLPTATFNFFSRMEKSLKRQPERTDVYGDKVVYIRLLT